MEMAQFGAGTELAAQCPRLEPPHGWRAWGAGDGPIPENVVQRALALSNDISVPLGTTESYPLPGVTALIRVEPHMWQASTGNQGCYHAAAVYLPHNAVAESSNADSLAKTIALLTAASLFVGIVATLSTWHMKS